MRTDDGIEYDPQDLAGIFEIVYDATNVELVDDGGFIHTVVFSLDGELVEETMLVW